MFVLIQFYFISQLQFEKAMKLAGEEFMERITYYQNGWLPAREFVAEAVKNRFEVRR